jgi:hypothetical protein
MSLVESLIEIGPPAYDVDIYIAYATADNFTGKPVYARPGRSAPWFASFHGGRSGSHVD